MPSFPLEGFGLRVFDALLSFTGVRVLGLGPYAKGLRVVWCFGGTVSRDLCSVLDSTGSEKAFTVSVYF